MPERALPVRTRVKKPETTRCEPSSPEGEGFDGRLNSPKVRASTAGRFIRKYENRRLGTRHLASLYTSQ